MQVGKNTVTIASGASLSGAFELTHKALVGLGTPAGWDAAGISLEVSFDNVTYRPFFQKAGEFTIASVAASRHYGLDLFGEGLYSFRWVKVRSGTSAAPVNQTANRVIDIFWRETALGAL